MTSHSADRAEPVGVFTALAWESAAVRANLQRVTRVEKRVWWGAVDGREVLIVTGGVGPQQAARTLERFAQIPLSAIVSVGCAGGLVPGLSPGQVVLASEVLAPMREDTHRLSRFVVDPMLRRCMHAAVTQAGVPNVEGSLLTSPSVLFSPEEKRNRQRVTGAVAVDMESGVYAALAAARALPFLALRVILDPVEMRLPLVADLMSPHGDLRPLKTATYVATHPHELLHLLALRQAQTTAARALTTVCRALFSLL